jgi:vacuolar-type H+-ATPase subunit H
MEKVWEELKKLEAKADQIKSNAQNKAKEITVLAQQEAEKLVANSKTYAEVEARQLYADSIEEANRNRVEQLKGNQEAAEYLKVQSEKRMKQASTEIVNSVLGETKH